MERYILVDPQGLSLSLLPESPITLEAGPTAAGITARGRPISGGHEPRYNFSFECSLSETDTQALLALASNRATAGLNVEVVVYYLWERHTDLTSQTREAVPDLAVTSTGGRVSYYPVLQGDIQVQATLKGHSQGSPWYTVGFTFYEGTIRRPTQ